MAIIYTYNTALPEANDILLGTEKSATLRNPTKNFKIGDLAKFIIDSTTGTSLSIPIFFDVTDPSTGLTQTTLVNSIMTQDVIGGTTLTVAGEMTVTGSVSIAGELDVEAGLADSTGKTGDAGQVLSSTGAAKTLWIPQSPPGGTTFTFTQGAVALVWTIQHNLDKFPSVTTVDDANNQYFGELEYVDSNNLTITWGIAFKGFAYLN